MYDSDEDDLMDKEESLKGDRQHVSYLQELVHNLESSPRTNEHLDIILKNARKTPIEYKVRMTLTTGIVGKGFTDALVRSVSRSTEIRPYDAAYSSPKGVIQVLPCGETPHLMEVVSEMARPDNDILKLSELQKDRGITAFAFSTSVGKNTITIWGKMNTSKILDPARYFMFSSKGGRFESISEKFIVAIPNRVDAVSNTDNVYIFDHSKFESIFEFKEGFLERIKKDKDKLGQLLADPDELVQSCERRLDPARKLYGALSNFDQRGLTTEIARKIAKGYKLNIKFNSAGLIDVSTSSTEDIVKLLDDDFVKSAQNPRRKYVTHGKTPA